MERNNALCFFFFFVLFVIVQFELFMMLSMERNHEHTLSFLRFREDKDNRISEVFHSNQDQLVGFDAPAPIPIKRITHEIPHQVANKQSQQGSHSNQEHNAGNFQYNEAPSLEKQAPADPQTPPKLQPDVKTVTFKKEEPREKAESGFDISKQKKYLLNFAHGCCKKAQAKNAETGRKFGFDVAHEYSMDDVDPDFRSKHNNILSQKQGGGFWLWKPYLILKTMEEANWGDIIIYTDAGSYWHNGPADRLVAYANDPARHVCNRPYSCAACAIDHELRADSPELLEKCGRDVVDNLRGQDVHVWDVGLKETSWTKRDVFVAMGVDREPITSTSQMSAHVIMVKKSESSMKFVKEWLDYATSPKELITNKASAAKNFPNFRSNRHDQSLLSVLYKKYGYSPNPYPSSDWLVHDRNHS